MVPGEHGYGWMPFGDTYLFESITGLGELETVALELTLSDITGMARAPIQTVALELEPQTTTALALSAAADAGFELAVSALTAMGMAPIELRSFTLEQQATSGMALAGYRRVAFWLTPYVGADPQAADATVVVFNANTLAATEYSIAALDVVSHDGELYFVLVDGLSKLAADAAGVAGSITTGDLDLSDGSLSLNLARLEMTSDGELHLTATAHQDGGERSVRYLIPTRAGANDRNRNVKLGNGVLGNTWSFTIAPPTGEACNWSLSGWKIEPGQFKLRRR